MSPRARSPKIVKRSLALLPPKDSLPAAALLSFLKETRGRTVWAERDLIKSLNITSAAARQALAILEMQGYVNQASKHEWLTTQQGEVVSGSKFPKYSRKSVEQSLDSFSDHLKRVNQDS